MFSNSTTPAPTGRVVSQRDALGLLAAAGVPTVETVQIPTGSLETMLAAARSARTYDASKGTLWVWLWGIARMQVARGAIGLRLKRISRSEM